MTWDELTEFYQVFARGRDSRDFNFGKGMLTLIQVLRSDAEISTMPLGLSMAHLLIAAPDNKLQSIHIMWVAADTYESFLTPYMDEAPAETLLSLNDTVQAVKDYLQGS